VLSTVLLILAVATFVLRYREQKGQLALVLRRDGGVYYLAVAREYVPGMTARLDLTRSYTVTQLVFVFLSTPRLVYVTSLY
jgi:hypothetical protein